MRRRLLLVPLIAFGVATGARASAQTPPPSPSVLVHVESPRAVDLSALSASAPAWARVCSAPCDVAVPLDAYYRVDGPGVRPSAAFRLAAGRPDDARLTLVVDPTSRGRHTAALALKIGGAAVLGAGVVLLLTDAVVSALTSPSVVGTAGGVAKSDAPTVLLVSGLAAVGVGVVGLLTGFALDGVTTVERRPDAR